MTDDQESAWWSAVEDGCRIIVHALLISITWPLWMLGSLSRIIAYRLSGPSA